ncbi:MAG: gliding motility-associated ABC transporter permease subunit GldF [Bacteroidales bacterium]
MGTLLWKEIVNFFSSLIGYIVIAIFLLGTGLFLFVFESDINILQTGFASLDGLFLIAPWIFLFLAPAITMRFFADESKSGTIELLLTYPITDKDIVLSKFLAGIILIFLSLIPTALYFVTIYALGSPPGNIDIAATIGAYIGLFLLSGVYIAIGTFISSITDNQIVSFIITAALCFIFFIGFDFIADFFQNGTLNTIFLLIGIREHYDSISRGVIDTRDILYFLSVIGFFLYMTILSIQNKRK